MQLFILHAETFLIFHSYDTFQLSELEAKNGVISSIFCTRSASITYITICE